MNEIFILKQDKEIVLSKIDEIFSKYHTINTTNGVQRRAILRTCCYDIDCMLNECFEPSLLGFTRCKQKISRCNCVDDPQRVVM